jgi:hypothetical protein
MCEHIFVKLFEEDETAAKAKRKIRAFHNDARERFIT